MSMGVSGPTMTDLGLGAEVLGLASMDPRLPSLDLGRPGLDF